MKSSDYICDFSWLVYFAFFGMACGALLLIGALGGLIWFIVNHVQIV
ncbi:hypothetical protein [Pseudohoeflea coraliihabitans]|uniref:Uncharacterized protein n=1 Tax=Pseudohoeflea coraliihabitans TaxID=2860393 RepID=A0ABS6WPJ1_9HYPH|nr:hypothetical protein [Pseudohoeflea sp. DP4N28-3]MBW3097825.1 hypothetical protein [Pseudohoeflea sp. DP4N28-3]MBW3098566.1 hypothetical protein [Pseudohoeflea sp. DP4N28-3]